MSELPIGEIICGDCLDVMRGWPTGCIDAVITDPPYGQKVAPQGMTWGGGGISGRARGFSGVAKAYPPCDWDAQRPSPEHFAELIRISKMQVIFGGNFFADLLPPSRCWIVWDKGRRTDHSDCELCWVSADAPARVLNYHINDFTARHDSEPRLHPTQKPIPVMEWLINKFTQPGALILDPFCGSGSTLTAAERLGRRWIGIDISAEYCAIARKRTAQKGLPLE